MKSGFILAALLCAAPLAAQTEVRGESGFSDTAFFTGGIRAPVFRIGGERTVWRIRVGGAVIKEGSYLYDGWGLEVTAGKRAPLPWRLLGTLRGGFVWTMRSGSSAHYTENETNGYRIWKWNTVALNGPFVDSATLYPFLSYGVQRPVYKKFFAEVQVRLSLVPTITQWGAGTAGRTQGLVDDRSWTPIPGYSIGIGYTF